MGVKQAREAIERMEKIERADFFAGMMFLGGLATLMAGVIFVATAWLGSVDPDTLAGRDVNTLIWMASIGIVTGLMFGLLFRQSMTRRKKLLLDSAGSSSRELLELAIDRRSADWVVWLLKKRLKATHSGMREAVAGLHYEKGTLQVYEQLGCEGSNLSRLEEIGQRGADREKARPLSPLLRGLYIIPVFVFVGIGWLSLRPEYFVEPYNYVIMVLFLIGLYAPFIVIGLVSRGRGADLAAEWDAVLRGVRTDNLVLLAGARVMRSKLELLRRAKENMPGAKEGVKEVERFRVANKITRF